MDLSHQCSTFGKGFPTLTEVTRHQVIHTGEKTYKCEDLWTPIVQKLFKQLKGAIKMLFTEQSNYHQTQGKIDQTRQHYQTKQHESKLDTRIKACKLCITLKILLFIITSMRQAMFWDEGWGWKVDAQSQFAYAHDESFICYNVIFHPSFSVYTHSIPVLCSYIFCVQRQKNNTIVKRFILLMLWFKTRTVPILNHLHITNCNQICLNTKLNYFIPVTSVKCATLKRFFKYCHGRMNKRSK